MAVANAVASVVKVYMASVGMVTVVAVPPEGVMTNVLSCDVNVLKLCGMVALRRRSCVQRMFPLCSRNVGCPNGSWGFWRYLASRVIYCS
jgi:hypothetical protein